MLRVLLHLHLWKTKDSIMNAVRARTARAMPVCHTSCARKILSMHLPEKHLWPCHGNNRGSCILPIHGRLGQVAAVLEHISLCRFSSALLTHAEYVTGCPHVCSMPLRRLRIRTPEDAILVLASTTSSHAPKPAQTLLGTKRLLKTPTQVGTNSKMSPVLRTYVSNSHTMEGWPFQVSDY